MRQRLCQRFGRSVGADEETSPLGPFAELLAGDINDRCRHIAKIENPSVACHAHDLETLEIRRHPESNVLSERMPVRKQAFSKALANDCGAWVILVICPLKITAT